MPFLVFTADIFSSNILSDEYYVFPVDAPSTMCLDVLQVSARGAWIHLHGRVHSLCTLFCRKQCKNEFSNGGVQRRGKGVVVQGIHIGDRIKKIIIEGTPIARHPNQGVGPGCQ